MRKKYYLVRKSTIGGFFDMYYVNKTKWCFCTDILKARGFYKIENANKMKEKYDREHEGVTTWVEFI